MTACTICPDRLLRPLLPLAFWLVVWQLAALAVGQSFILPGPAAVLGTLIQLAGVPSFWQTALLSLVRVLAGLLAGTLLGALTAALTCASRWADVLLSPAVRVIRAVPVVSFILFVLLWTRRGLVPVVVSALMVLPVVWGNVSRGIRETDPKLLEQAGALRFSRLKTVPAWGPGTGGLPPPGRQRPLLLRPWPACDHLGPDWHNVRWRRSRRGRPQAAFAERWPRCPDRSQLHLLVAAVSRRDIDPAGVQLCSVQYS